MFYCKQAQLVYRTNAVPGCFVVRKFYQADPPCLYNLRDRDFEEDLQHVIDQLAAASERELQSVHPLPRLAAESQARQEQAGADASVRAGGRGARRAGV